jgi:hypothetical protein
MLKWELYQRLFGSDPGSRGRPEVGDWQIVEEPPAVGPKGPLAWVSLRAQRAQGGVRMYPNRASGAHSA